MMPKPIIIRLLTVRGNGAGMSMKRRGAFMMGRARLVCLIPLLAVAWPGCQSAPKPTVAARASAAQWGNEHFGGKLADLRQSLF
jgi:hypothetical protein